MAGRSETCSHVAATIYLLEFAAKAEACKSCTDVPSGWLPPTMTAVGAKEIKNVNFSSASARLKRLESLVGGEDQQQLGLLRQF